MASTTSPSDTSAAAIVPIPTAGAVVIGDLDEPVKGSWVAELEDAKEARIAARRRRQRSENECITAANDTSPGTADVLLSYLRLCRAYEALRQWDRLLVVSKKGMKACASASSDAAVARRASGHMAPVCFRVYQTLAEAELAVPTLLNRETTVLAPGTNLREVCRHLVLVRGWQPGSLAVPGHVEVRFANAPALVKAVLAGDIRLMEEFVSLGTPIDQPIQAPQERSEQSCILPPGSSPLVVACQALALAVSSSIPSHIIDPIAECAMQLVNLGANPSLRMPRDLGPGIGTSETSRRLLGKSAFQIAAMSQRRPLVAHMWAHMQMSPEERADLIHCRCGSRLPWKQCHSTGVGKLPHFVVDAASGQTCYRVSPLGRCPCRSTNKTYYKCCWSDNRVPVYQNDVTGALLCRRVDSLNLPSVGLRLRNLAEHDPAVASVLQMCQQGSNAWIVPFTRLFRKHPSLFDALCKDVGPKSRMTKWNRRVYAGCVERLEEPFLWRDVHWDLDRSGLRRRSDEWNEALDKYCDDVGVVGAERASVVDAHTAHVCGPCGFAGCHVFESKIRECLRCAGCRAIAYCSKECQEADWSVHRKVCPASPDAPVASSELVLYKGTAPVNLGQN